jgi:predicted nucleic acid-binding OB-fold protein
MSFGEDRRRSFGAANALRVAELVEKVRDFVDSLDPHARDVIEDRVVIGKRQTRRVEALSRGRGRGDDGTDTATTDIPVAVSELMKKYERRQSGP